MPGRLSRPRAYSNTVAVGCSAAAQPQMCYEPAMLKAACTLQGVPAESGEVGSAWHLVPVQGTTTMAAGYTTAPAWPPQRQQNSEQQQRCSLMCVMQPPHHPDFTSPPLTAPLCFQSGRLSCGTCSSSSTCSTAGGAPASVTTSTITCIPWISPISVTRKRSYGGAFADSYMHSCQGYGCQDSLVPRKALCRRPGQGHVSAHSCQAPVQQWDCRPALQVMHQHRRPTTALPACPQAPVPQPQQPVSRSVPAGSPLLPLLRFPSNSVPDMLAYACKWLGFRELGTLQLAMHCCTRLNQHPDLALVLGQTRLCYSVVTLWLAAKLEERRGGLAGAQRVAQLIGTTTKAVLSMEMQIFQLLEWTPYRGFAPQEEVLVFL